MNLLPMTHTRLCACADVVVAVITETAGDCSWVRLNEVWAAHRSRFAGFTTDEIDEATKFLIRLGMLELRS